MLESEQGIFEQVLHGDLDFSSDPWPSISDDAKDLVRKMLIRDPKRRLTAHEVLCKYSMEFMKLFFFFPFQKINYLWWSQILLNFLFSSLTTLLLSQFRLNNIVINIFIVYYDYLILLFALFLVVSLSNKGDQWLYISNTRFYMI